MQSDEGVAEHDPKGALELLKHESNVRSQSYNRVFGQWALQDPLEAAAALEQLPSPSHRNAAILALSTIWTEDDPLATLQWSDDATWLIGSEKRTLMRQIWMLFLAIG